MPPRKIQLFDAVHGIESREMKWVRFKGSYLHAERKKLGNSVRQGPLLQKLFCKAHPDSYQSHKQSVDAVAGQSTSIQ